MHEVGAKVKAGDRLAEWDPFTLPIITETSGIVKYQDLVEGTTLEERVDEATGIAQRVVTENRAFGRKKNDDLRDRTSVVWGKRVSVSVDLGGGRSIKKKKKK